MDDKTTTESLGDPQAGATGMEKLAAAELPMVLTEDQKAEIVVAAIRSGEKVIEIEGSLFTRGLYHELARSLGSEHNSEALDKDFDEAQAWVQEPILPVTETAEAILNEPALQDTDSVGGVKPIVQEFVATGQMAGYPSKTRDTNLVTLTVIAGNGRSVTRTVKLGSQNDAAAVTGAFIDALHIASFGE